MMDTSLGQLALQVLLDGLQEIHRVQVHVGLDVLDAANAAGQVLGNLAGVHGVDARLLQLVQNLTSSGVLSSLARRSGPRVHAKMEAIGLVEMARPFWCLR